MATHNIPENRGWYFCLDGPAKNTYVPIQHDGSPVESIDVQTVDGEARYIRASQADTIGIFAYKFDGLLSGV